MKERSETRPVVIVIDDDASVRRGVSNLVRSTGLEVKAFASAAEMLLSERVDVPSCLVLDVKMPELTGLELQTELAKASIHIPIIFITAHGDIPMTVAAMKAGAVDFLTKPFGAQEMLDAIAMAIERDRRRRQEETLTSGVRTRFASLTAREREVMAFVTAGMMNKQVAAQLSLSEITVKIHRGRIMRKMNARSLADLVRMAELVGVHRAAS